MKDIETCYELKGLITSTIGAKLSSTGGVLELCLSYCLDEMEVETKIFFEKVRSYRYKADSYSSVWEVDSSSCRLIEIKKSSWVDELKKSYIYGKDDWVMHHFVFYFPEEGSYEIVAEKWSTKE